VRSAVIRVPNCDFVRRIAIRSPAVARRLILQSLNFRLEPITDNRDAGFARKPRKEAT
jgi:hypothetical protein